MLKSMDPADELRAAVEAEHKCKATPFYVAHLINTFRSDWDGRVHVFDLEGHPSARRAYAWCFPIPGYGGRQTYTVLETAGFRSAYDAVKTAVSGVGD